MNNILVVGAGPTGLTMAAELARHGARCRIIDKASGPAAESRAIGVVPRTMEVFETMDVVEPIARAAVQLRGAGVFAGGERIAHFDFDDLDSRHRVAVLPQGETERILAAHVAGLGVTVEREVELTELSQHAESVTARLRHRNGREETLHAPWVIGCDGAHSTVRRALGVNFTGDQYDEAFLLADVHLESQLEWDDSYSFLHPAGQLLMFPLPNNVVRVVAILDDRSRDRVPDEPTLADMQALVDERGPGGVRLTDGVWMSRFRVSRRMVQQFRHQRTFLAGDAAHIHSPAGGQGMNTGIQDAHNLAWKLALVVAGRSPEALLDTYHAEREPIARAVLQMTDRFTRIATLRNPLAQRARNFLLSWLAGIEAVEHRLVEDIAELTIDYRRSPIIVEDRAPFGDRIRQGLPAGTRAPDAELRVIGSTTPVRLYELLRNPRHALLLFAGTEPTVDDRQNVATLADEVAKKYSERIGVHVLSDTGRDVERHYGVDAPWVYLVRPDGYIGFRGRPTIDRLGEYFQRIFL